jgi:hypothetical protein
MGRGRNTVRVDHVSERPSLFRHVPSGSPGALCDSPEPLFYLGSHHATSRWWALGVPLFVSVRVLGKRKKLPTPIAPWALDSGGFTELSRPPHRWVTSEDAYVEQIHRFAGMPFFQWAAPQDWMCEPWIIAATGLTVPEHQERTVASFLSLRERVGHYVIPVLQGYSPREYDRCVDLYAASGVALAAEPVVGLGSVCRRSGTSEAVRLIRYLHDNHRLRLHGFGLKDTAFRACRGQLTSSDSMAWSATARREGRDSNSPEEAMAWRARLLAV